MSTAIERSPRIVSQTESRRGACPVWSAYSTLPVSVSRWGRFVAGLQPVHERSYMLRPKVGTGHREMPGRVGRSLLHYVAGAGDGRCKLLEDAQPVRVELVVVEVKGEQLGADRREMRLRVVVRRRLKRIEKVVGVDAPRLSGELPQEIVGALAVGGD